MANLRIGLVLAALVSGCAGPVSNANPEQEQATDIAIAAWELRFGSTTCDSERDLLDWQVVADSEAVTQRCGVDELVDACFFARFDGTSTIYLQEDNASGRRWAYAHELTHWLQRCSGREDFGDSEHSDPSVWPSFERALERQLRAELSQ